MGDLVDNVLAIIPARGGSQAIPLKNVATVGGISLISRTAAVALASEAVSRVIVSTDHPSIEHMAHNIGAEVITRPSEISTDESSSEDALIHVLEELKSRGEHLPSIIVFLQCTAPLVSTYDVDMAIAKFRNDGADSLLSVTRFDRFVWMQHTDESVQAVNHDSSVRLRRQEIDGQFLENGAIYVMRTDGFLSHRNRFFGKISLYEMPKARSIEIDDQVDLVAARAILNSGIDRKSQKLNHYRQPQVVAEIGCNHCGSLNTAEALVESAARSGATYVKFQKRHPIELLPSRIYNSPHPSAQHAYGQTYGQHREFLEFPLEFHKHLLGLCKEYKIGYGCSVWDMTSARQMASLPIDYVKIPSSQNTNLRLIKFLCEQFPGPIHVSTGMTSIQERDRIISTIRSCDRLADTVIYHCVSAYPTLPRHTYLLEVERLVGHYSHLCAAVGLSGHHTCTAIDIAAFTLGASWIERHFTLNRNQRGSDHAFSLTPDDLSDLVRRLQDVAIGLRLKPDQVPNIEKQAMDRLGKHRDTTKQ